MPGAADEYLTAGRRFQRVRSVGDVPGQQRGDAGWADARPAAPAAGDVAGVGEVEHAAPVNAERRGDAAAGEDDQRPGSWRARRLVRRPAYLSGDPRVDRG